MSLLLDQWYRGGWLAGLLAPLGWLYGGLMRLRARRYASGRAEVRRLPVPVIVVGNLTVGGSGKTLLVDWLARGLRARGLRVGLVSRGYGGRAPHWPQPVGAEADSEWVGDEPVLLVRHTGCPMWVGPDRVAAAEALLARHPCDVLLSDDGLQHLRLGRDLEIGLIDGGRRFGNGRCLPAGPLREPLGAAQSRWRALDWRVAKGRAAAGEWPMQLRVGAVRQVMDERVSRDLREFAVLPVHACAGIANPESFFELLRRAGLEVQGHAFPDHYRFTAAELDFGDGRPVLVTEKDAVKCRGLGLPNLWYVPVEAEVDDRLLDEICAALQALPGRDGLAENATGRDNAAFLPR